MHRGQRSREQANKIVTDPNAKKWYQETFWIIVMLLLLWPVGLVLAWRSDWPSAAKIIATVAVLVLVGWIIYDLPRLMQIASALQAALAH